MSRVLSDSKHTDLTPNSDRAAAEAERAMQLAENTLMQLPLAEYLTIEHFRKENRDFYTVVVPFEILLRYLRDAGTPDDLLTTLEESAAGC